MYNKELSSKVKEKMRRTRHKMELIFIRKTSENPYSIELKKLAVLPNVRWGVQEEIQNHKSLSLRRLIEEIFHLSRRCCSFDKNLRYETRPGAARSAIDIWRHVKHYRPDVTVMDVMREMRSMTKFLSCGFCPNVKRLVFSVKHYPGDTDVEHITKMSEFGVPYMYWNEVGES